MKTHLDPQSILSAAQTTSVRDPKQARDEASLKKSCQDFEAIFMQSMFKAMRKTVPEGELIKKSSAEKMYEEMLDMEIATEISKKQSMGLADQIFQHTKKYIKD